MCSMLKDALSKFPFLDQAGRIDKLLEKYPKYIKAALAKETEPDAAALLEWWRSHATRLPNRAALARNVFVMQASSAGSERVFSCVRRAFTKHQLSALSDVINATVMLEYNHRKPSKKKAGTTAPKWYNVVIHDLDRPDGPARDGSSSDLGSK